MIVVIVHSLFQKKGEAYRDVGIEQNNNSKQKTLV